VKQQIKTFLAGGLLALALIGTTMAGPLEDAKAALQRSDYAAALQILRPLAEQGNADAQFNLAAVYAQGLGVPQDDAQAFAWCRKAAEQGNASAQFNLGVIYDRGQGVSQDYAQAVVWYRKAAEQGEQFAQFNLGVMNANSHGVTQNYVEALMWFYLVAAAHPSDTRATENRDTLVGKMTPAQIAEAQHLASEWKPK
jgi:uncharacterized protein